MEKIKSIFTGALLFISSALFAQQGSSFTMYRYHMNMVNPAYVGVNKQTLITSSIRSQWAGVKEAPETQAVSFGTPVGENLALGVSVVSDKTFIEKQSLVNLDFSYRVQMNESIDLYFGLKVGGNFYDVNTSGLQMYIPQYDPALNSISGFNPNNGVGALLKHEKYFVSLSVPRMLNTKKVKEKEGVAVLTTDKLHLYLSGGYDFVLNPEGILVLKPSIMLRYANGLPISLDINTMLQIQEYFEIGATYRNNKTFAGIVDFTISKRLMIGYAYEVSANPIMASAKNSNEFIARFTF